MPTRAISIFKGSVALQAAVILSAWVVASAGGCAHRYYRATSLPAELVAPPAERVDTALVSRLARHTGGGELIDQGDLLEVTVDDGKKPPQTAPVWVQEDGTARVPLIGSVPLGGLTLQEAGQMVAGAGIERGIYVAPYPYVTVEMKQQRMNRVMVIGAVQEPGVKELPRSSSYLLAALVAAGNLSEDAGPDIEIIHCGGGRSPFSSHPPQVADGPRAELTSYGAAGPQEPSTVHVNLISATKQGQTGHYLEDRDVVVVHERQPRSIHLIGLVRDPGQYELPPDQDVRLLDALAMAGGRTSQIADKVWIIRRVPGQEDAKRIRASVRDAKSKPAANVRLAAGDLVSVEETPATFLLDLLKGFFRVGASMPLL